MQNVLKLITARPSVRQATRLAVLAVLALVLPCMAGSVVGDYTGGGVTENYQSATGYWFTPNVNLTVNLLGFYDLSGTGLNGTHDVGIFQANGTVVVSGTVAAGTTDPLIAGTVGGTRVISVAPTLLTAGTQYYIEADNNNLDEFAYGGGAVTFDPSLTWNSYGDLSSNNIFFGIPSEPGGVDGNLGPNFGALVTPEPGSMALILCGVAALGLTRRLRRQ